MRGKRWVVAALCLGACSSLPAGGGTDAASVEPHPEAPADQGQLALLRDDGPRPDAGPARCPTRLIPREVLVVGALTEVSSPRSLVATHDGFAVSFQKGRDYERPPTVWRVDGDAGAGREIDLGELPGPEPVRGAALAGDGAVPLLMLSQGDAWARDTWLLRLEDDAPPHLAAQLSSDPAWAVRDLSPLAQLTPVGPAGDRLGLTRESSPELLRITSSGEVTGRTQVPRHRFSSAWVPPRDVFDVRSIREVGTELLHWSLDLDDFAFGPEAVIHTWASTRMEMTSVAVQDDGTVIVGTYDRPGANPAGPAALYRRRPGEESFTAFYTRPDGHWPEVVALPGDCGVLATFGIPQGGGAPPTGELVLLGPDDEALDEHLIMPRQPSRRVCSSLPDIVLGPRGVGLTFTEFCQSPSNLLFQWVELE